ncbi:MAG TPA: oligosaccharide flippase family protein, partial [Chloroflexota bacterium]|nr:oligosaccharide flippase family protein [Chloroflexota bacterium]
MNVARFALFLTSAGAVVLVASRGYHVRLPFSAENADSAEQAAHTTPATYAGQATHHPRPKRGASRSAGKGVAAASALMRIPMWQPLAVLLVIADLFAFGSGFYTAADPQLLAFVPPAVQFLQQDKSLFRVTSLDAPGDKTFNPNAGMFYGLQDIRGYDSLIPKQYADWMNMVEGQGELLYNRIAPLYCACNLDSALLDLANVKYVLTTQTIGNPKFTKVYAGEINIYRNERVLPRAFVVYQADTLHDLAQLKSLDPATQVLIDGPVPSPAPSPPCTPSGDALVTRYSANEVAVATSGQCGGWLVVADAYADGWQAFDAANGASEREVPVYRADGNFRAVQLPAGRHVVRFKYNPLSFRVGLYLSFFAAMALVLLAGYWAWGRLSREQTHERSAQRVLKNSALPITTALLNKAIDTVFAAFMLRLLGVEGAGKYAFAVIVITYCDIFVNFGFGTLLTREVARDRAIANRFLSHTIVMRFVLLALLAPLLAVFLWGYRSFAALPDDTTLAIVLLALSLVPGALAGALSSVFYAHEQIEYPAAVTVVATLLKVTLGVAVLLAGLGFVGLAGASIVVNMATLVILLYLFVRRFFVPRIE